MYTNHSILYPILGVGIFFVGFWTGFILAYEAGLPGIALPLIGLFTGIGGIRFVIALERRDQGEFRRSAPNEELPWTASAAAARMVAPIFKPR